MSARGSTDASIEGRPSRTASIAIGAAALAAFAVFVLRGPRRPAPVDVGPTSAAPASPPVASDTPEGKLDHAISELQALPPLDNPGTSKLLEALEDVQPTNIGRKMPDGSDPPPLPKTAPRRVRFGLVLVRYQGAQLAPSFAPAKDEALRHAQLLAQVAKDDFAAAVKSGDVGSTTDIGTVKRGILEPAIEYVLFTLPVGWVSEVVDTPRGFWVMKRLR
jgi:hypothetical protein